jgi:hypothetical protein
MSSSGGTITQIITHAPYLNPISVTGLTTMPQIMRNETNFSHEPIYSSFQGTGLTRTLIVPRTGDLWYPEYIYVEQSNEDTEIKIKSISIDTNGYSNTIFDINVDFMKQIYPNFVTIRGNRVIYKLNIQHFMNNNNFRYVGTISTYHVKINLHNETNITDIKLMSDYTFLDINIRRTIADMNTIESLTKEHRYLEADVNTPYVSIRTTMNGYTKGFFIETESGIDNIKKFTIKVNGLDRYDLDDIQIEHLTQKINDNMFYLPLTPGESFTEFNMNGGLQLDRIDCINYIFEGHNAFNGKIKVHTMVFNVMNNGNWNIANRFNIGQSNILNIRTTPAPPIPAITSTPTTTITTVTTINKRYTGTDFCVISLEEIVEGAEYMECTGCTKAFIKEYIEEWLTNSRTCPHCRINWTSTTICINTDGDVNVDDVINDLEEDVIVDNCVDPINNILRIMSGIGGIGFSN